MISDCSGQRLGTRTFSQGGGNTNQTMYFVGNIADVIIYNTVLTASQVASVQSYLRTKYSTP